MPDYGISRSGASAEDVFIALTGATKAERAALGDALLDGAYVEVKAASSTTLNQVRAVKYITLVAYSTPFETWYVVPAHDVVRLVTGKKRGQHTENPYESATLSLAHLGQYRVADVSEIGDAVRCAIAESARHPELKEAMDWVLKQARQLSIDSRNRVLGVLNG